MPLKQARSEYDVEGSSLAPVDYTKIRDLMRAIDNDWSINSLEKIRLLAEIKRLTNNAPSWTPLGNIMYGGFSALFGNLIAKYFGMGPTARTIATFVGAGLGNRAYNQTHPQRPGWKNI